jgi:hypothetical protein
MPRFAPFMLPLLLLVATSACDAFWEGPTLPSGATYVAYTVLSELGPNSISDTEIAAATSIAALRASIAQRTHQPDCKAFGISSDSCWEQIADAPGHLYVAVTFPNYCGAVRETAALSGRTLYFIDWFGRPQGPCGDAYPRPHFSLLSFNRSDLPPPGPLTVDLQLQGGRTGDSSIEVTLG